MGGTSFGCKSMYKDIGIEIGLYVHTDAEAAKGGRDVEAEERQAGGGAGRVAEEDLIRVTKATGARSP